MPASTVAVRFQRASDGGILLPFVIVASNYVRSALNPAGRFRFQPVAARAHQEGVLPKRNGARVSHPQQPGLPNERTKFHGFLGC